MQTVYLVYTEDCDYHNNDSVFSTREKAEARIKELYEKNRDKYYINEFSLDDEDCELAKQGYKKYMLVLNKEGQLERSSEHRIQFDEEAVGLPTFSIWDSRDEMMNAVRKVGGKEIERHMNALVIAKSEEGALAIANKARRFILDIGAFKEKSFQALRETEQYEIWRRTLNANP